MRLHAKFAVVALAGAGFAAWRAVPRHAAPTATMVCERLWLGGNVAAPPGGAEAVLNLSHSPDPYQARFHRWEPLRNAAPTPTVEWLRSQTTFVAEQRRAGRTVFVHCHGGVSRSAMVVAACLMAELGCTSDEALATLRARRPEVALNPVFRPLLAAWESALRRAAPRGN